MKRGILILLFCAFTSGLFAQVMDDSGVKNTMWTGFGMPFKGDFAYHGVIDCLQARLDIWQFTVEGMINWGVLTDWDKDGFDGVWFGCTSDNALTSHYYAHHGDWDNDNYKSWGNNTSAITIKTVDENGVENIAKKDLYNNAVIPQTAQSDHYVNFIWNPVAGLQFGIGTKLNWGLGPSPGYNAWTWEHNAHIRGGGFSTYYDDRDGESVPNHPFNADKPGTADVVGYVHYANTYAKKALGVRYKYDGENFGFEIGASIPQATHTDKFAMNLAGSIRPVKFLTVSTSFEGLFHEDMNWYVGLDIQTKFFGLDVYFTWDNIDDDSDKWDDPMSWSTGLAFAIKANDDKMFFRPEFAINWFECEDWTPAWHIGLLFDFDITKMFNLNVWTSFAMGSMDKNWEDNEDTEDYDGGIIFDIRPQFTLNFNERHALSVYIDLEDRRAFDHENRFGFSTGVYWSYKLLTGKLTFAQKEKQEGEESDKSKSAKK